MCKGVCVARTGQAQAQRASTAGRGQCRDSAVPHRDETLMVSPSACTHRPVLTGVIYTFTRPLDVRA